jgi:hypothetical protein
MKVRGFFKSQINFLPLRSSRLRGENVIFHFISPVFSGFYFLPVFLSALQKNATRVSDCSGGATCGTLPGQAIKDK